ncbi:MAG: ADP-ribosylglycohydrolase family protein [Geodermatophilaceae bacterium]|nr:ADP-ribosylglycohydrolase family protein [Geodermatophilaceae bacterium]
MRELDMLLGVLYGDCLGAPYEFSSGPLTGPLQVGPSVFGHPAGHGTDDTETTIAVAQGLGPVKKVV